ncbi:MAG: hypothetical protein L6Q81_12580 [Bacteroidia bacterium]|nr:hypothetical protein [Bacteroidia bacterium]
MTTYESLVSLTSNISKQEHKLVRRYLIGKSLPGQSTSKSIKLFDLLISERGKNFTSAQIQKRLGLARHHATFGRLVAQLRRRILEALCLPIVVAGNENYSERTKAEIHFHRQYLKAIILFEAGDYAGADEILLTLIFWTEKYELCAERMAAAEFLMRTIRIYGHPDALKHFKDVPGHSRNVLTVIACAEHIRRIIDAGNYEQARKKFSALNDNLKGVTTIRALFVIKGIEAIVAATAGNNKKAEKLFFEQLGYCNHDAVRSEEDRAQVYTDIAQVSVRLKKEDVAREYIAMAQRCKRRFKKTVGQLEKLQSDMKNINA